MACVYILYSKGANKFYIGSTKDLYTRMVYHSHKEFKSSYTSKYNNWVMFFCIDSLEVGQAKKVEAYIKKMKSRMYIENLKKYPEMVKSLIAKCT